MIENNRPAHAGILVPPPLIYLLSFIAGWMLDRYLLGVPVAGDVTPASLRLSGEVLMILGAILALWAFIAFRRARTSVLPFRPASELVTDGPYRFTRNPMYVGMATVYAGASLAMNMALPLLLLPLALIAVYRLAIRPEERYLQQRFPEEYPQYRQRVRRWL